MRKRIAMILALVIVASMALVGCGKGGSEKDALVGLWTGDLDVTDVVNDEFMAGMGDDAEGLEGYKDLKLTVSLEMREDDTYTLAMDEASAQAFLESVKVQTKDILMKYMENMLADMGADMSVEEAMEAAGISVDDMIEEAFGDNGLDVSGLIVNVSGNYLVKSGEIHFADGSDEPKDVIPNPYTLDGDKLTIEADKVSATDEVSEFLFPLVLEKAK